MPAQIRFTHNFDENLEAIREFLLSVSPADAVERYAVIEGEIVSVASLLSEHPEIGRPLRSPETASRKTKLAVARLTRRTQALKAGALREYLLHDYVVLYAATPDMVHLLAIKHQRQLAYSL